MRVCANRYIQHRLFTIFLECCRCWLEHVVSKPTLHLLILQLHRISLIEKLYLISSVHFFGEYRFPSEFGIGTHLSDRGSHKYTYTQYSNQTNWNSIQLINSNTCVVKILQKPRWFSWKQHDVVLKVSFIELHNCMWIRLLEM